MSCTLFSLRRRLSWPLLALLAFSIHGGLAQEQPPLLTPKDSVAASDTSAASIPDSAAADSVAAVSAEQARRDSLRRVLLGGSAPPPDSSVVLARAETLYGGRFDRLLAARLPLATHSFGPGAGGELSSLAGLSASLVEVRWDRLPFSHPLDHSVRLEFIPLELLARADPADIDPGLIRLDPLGGGLNFSPLFSAQQKSRVNLFRGDHQINQAYFTRRFNDDLVGLFSLASHNTLDRNLRDNSGVSRYQTRWAWALNDRWLLVPALWVVQANRELTRQQSGVAQREINRQRRSHLSLIGPGLGGTVTVDASLGEFTDKYYSFTGGIDPDGPARYRTKQSAAAVSGSLPGPGRSLHWFGRLEQINSWGLASQELVRRALRAGFNLNFPDLRSLDLSVGFRWDAVSDVSPGLSPSFSLGATRGPLAGANLRLARLYREPSLDSRHRQNPDPRHFYIGNARLTPAEAVELAFGWERTWKSGRVELMAVTRHFSSLTRFATELEPLFPGRAEADTLSMDSGLLWSGLAASLRQDYGPVTFRLNGQSWAPDDISGWGVLPGVPLFRVIAELQANRAIYRQRALVHLLIGAELLGRRNFPGASLPDQSVVYLGAGARIRTLVLHLYVDDFLAQNWQGAPGYFIQGPRITWGLTWDFLD